MQTLILMKAAVAELFKQDVNVFPIDPIGNVIVWKFVINHVTNIVHAN